MYLYKPSFYLSNVYSRIQTLSNIHDNVRLQHLKHVRGLFVVISIYTLMNYFWSRYKAHQKRIRFVKDRETDNTSKTL